ncbi:hypothetical protein K438DRAFT_1765771 [Mycena galopus ATCC 62051]|nr:hypothetical protein K438DRAFT_1765771 [Mycena galopus ATCC 62051]
MPEAALPDTSDEEEPEPPLTRAEKDKRTRALAQAEAKAEAPRLSHEIGWFSVILRLNLISLHAAEEAGGQGAKLAAYTMTMLLRQSQSKSKPKPKKAATDDEDDVLPSQSDDDKESESASHSSNEDESLSNMLDESSPAPEDDIFDLPHRRCSSSSVGFAAPDTDFNLDTNDKGQEDTSEGFPNIGRHYRHFGICQQHHLPRH